MPLFFVSRRKPVSVAAQRTKRAGIKFPETDEGIEAELTLLVGDVIQLAEGAERD